MLRTLVAAGELPPVEERLPEEPMVVKPIEEIGQYGGTMHMFTMNADSILGPHVIFMGDNILHIAPDLKAIRPNIVKDRKFSKDGKTLTLYLRKGMKWSDGARFTADDIMFWYEDIVLNNELTPVKPMMWSPGGKLMKAEKIDDYTVRLNFAVPSPQTEINLAHGSGCQSVSTWGFYAPKHYLKQFHPRYTPKEKIEKLAKEKGFDYWYQLFQDKGRTNFGISMNPDLPTLSAYVCKTKETSYIIFERNSFYWKIDPEGNQLPYIDRYRIMMVGSQEMINAKVMTGEADFEGMMTTLKNYPLYKKNAEKGDYRVLIYDNSYSSTVYLQPNQTSKNPVLRKIFQDARFRRALSLAINREEISEVLHFGLSEPRQVSVLDNSMYFEPEFAKAYIEYNPEKANELLDEMGLKWDERHKYRLRPDGKPLHPTIEYCESDQPRTAILEMTKDYWEKIGVPVTLKLETSTLEGMRAVANEIDIGVHVACGATDILFLNWPKCFFPVLAGWEMTWCPAWAQWYDTGGDAGEEPPAHMKRLQKIYDEMKITVDKSKLIQLGKEVCRAQAENLWVIGTVRVPYCLIAKNNLRNLPEKGIWGWDGYFAYIYHPEQFFFKQK